MAEGYIRLTPHYRYTRIPEFGIPEFRNLSGEKKGRLPGFLLLRRALELQPWANRLPNHYFRSVSGLRALHINSPRVVCKHREDSPYTTTKKFPVHNNQINSVLFSGVENHSFLLRRKLLIFSFSGFCLFATSFLGFQKS